MGWATARVGSESYVGSAPPGDTLPPPPRHPRPTKTGERPSESLGGVGSESCVGAGPLQGGWGTLTVGE